MAGNGLRLVRQSGMTDGFTGGLQEFNIDPTNTTAIFTGDPVSLDASGFAEEAISAGVSGNDFTIAGVFMGCRYVDADGAYVFRNYWDGVAGRTNIVAHVAIPASGVFLIRGASGTDYTSIVAGARYGMLANSGSTAYGDSRATLGTAAAATGPLRILRISDLPGNDPTDEPWIEVNVVRQQMYFTAA